MPRYHYPGITRSTVEQSRTFTMTFLKEHGYLDKQSYTSGTVVWSMNDEETGRIGISVDMRENPPRIRFKYKSRSQWEEEWKDMDYSFELTSIPCNFGGKRWYFVCGVYKDGRYCGRRVSKLHSIGDYFCCRTCNELTYESCNRSNYYRDGYFKLLDQSFKADEYYEKHVKRTHYRGKPTRKYRRYLKMVNGVTERDIAEAINESLTI